MPTRDLGNRRVTVWIGLASAIADFQKISISEISGLKNASPAIRWDGFDFGSQAADQIDDRALDDEAGATLPGFAQFGGSVPFYWPLDSDTSSIVRQIFNILKQTRQDLVVVERVGWKNSNEPIAAGDVVNVYRVINDAISPATEGQGGAAYTVTMLPQGTVYPWTIVPSATPTAVSIVGAATATLSLAGVFVTLRGASYLGNNIATRAVWASSNDAVATVKNGVIVGKAAGTANITASFPGGTASTAVAVTVGA